MTRLLAPFLIALLSAASAAAQDPAEPIEPPVEPPVEATEEAGDETGVDEEQAEPEVPLTPAELDRQRKLEEEAAERAAKREERRIKRNAKKEAEGAKRLEKERREGVKLAEQIAMLIQEGHDLLGEGELAPARQRFRKANELEAGSSWAAQMGLAKTELAGENFALAVRNAQGAVKSTTQQTLKAEAFTLAGNATLAARPATDSAHSAAKAGIDMYEATALRFFMRAVTAAPGRSKEAMAHIERRFPSREPTTQSERLMARYLAADEETVKEPGEQTAGQTAEQAAAAHAHRALLAYEAQLTGRVPRDLAVAVVGTILPPKRTGGPGVKFTPAKGEESRRRLIVSFEVNAGGGVGAVTVLNSVNENLDAAAVKTLRQWTYEPAQLPDGQPIAVFWLAAVNVQPAPETPAPEVETEGSAGESLQESEGPGRERPQAKQ
jgi:TonB family protein